MARAAASRALTIAAAGFLGFDGAALAGLGLWTDNLTLIVIGAGLFLSSGLVLLAWRRHRRSLDEIDAARRAVRDEAREIAKLLREP